MRARVRTRGIDDPRRPTGVLAEGGVWGASPSGVRGGAPRRKIGVLEARNRQFRLPNCPRASASIHVNSQEFSQKRSQKAKIGHRRLSS